MIGRSSILRDKANFDILEGLISVLLGEEVKIEEQLESELNGENDRDKLKRVDVKAKNSKDQIIIIKIQLTRQLDYLEKILYGTCKVFTEHINIGNKYDQIKKVYWISILYCDYGKGDDYVYHGQTVFKGIHTGTDLMVKTKEQGVIVPHLPREVFPEYYLVRVNAYDKIPETPLDEWITYLKTSKVREDTHTPGLQEIREKLRVFTLTPKERRAYDEHIDNIMVQNDVLDTARAEGYAEGYAEGLAEVRAEGHAECVAEALIDVSRALKRQGIASENISTLTGLPIAEIETL